LVDEFVLNQRKKRRGILSLCNGLRIFKIGLIGTHLFVKVPRPGDSEGTFSVFESNCHLLLPVYPLIGSRGNHVECLAQGHKQTCRPISTLPLFYAERQAGKLRIATFQVF